MIEVVAEAEKLRQAAEAAARAATPTPSPTTGNGHTDALPVATPTSLLDWARWFIRLGILVFVLDAGSKLPRKGTNGHSDATLDDAVILALFAANPRCNLGVVPGRLPNGMYLSVIDLDTKHGKNGVQFFRNLCATNGVDADALLRSTLVIRTATGGLHIYVVSDRPVRHGDGMIEKTSGFDMKANGRGYVVSPGSIVNGVAYTVEHMSDVFVSLPETLCKAIGYAGAPTAESDKESKTPPVPIDHARAVERATEYLLHHAPVAIDGQGGNLCTFKVAAHCKDIGLNEAETFDTMFLHYSPRCQGPWTPEELEQIVSNAYNYTDNPIGSAAPEVEFAEPLPEGMTDHTVTRYEFKKDWTDTGNANVMVSLAAGNLKYIHETRTYLEYDGQRWQSTKTKRTAERAALRVAEHYHGEIVKLETLGQTLDGDAKKKNDKTIESLKAWEHRCRAKKNLDAMIALASTKAEVELSAIKLDTNAALLGVLNGVIDLQTGALRTASRDEYLTLCCPVVYDSAAPAPTWERVIKEVTALPGDGPNSYTARPELAAYLQKILGYAITGLTNQHKMMILNGGGSNGKSVVTDQSRSVLGPYSTSLPSSCLLQAKFVRDGESPTPYAADLFRKRFVVSSETRAGFKLDTDFVKSQTGDTFQKARHLRGNPFEFETSHKLFLQTNAMPTIEHLDEAIRGRLIVVPFDRCWNRPGIPDPNPAWPMADETLPVRLRDEAAGILAWLVRGAVKFFTEGLGKPPDAVKAKTLGYLAEQDSLAQWIAACCERCENHKDGTTPTELHQAYNAWADENDAPLMSQREFSAGMKSHRFEAKGVWKDGQSLKRYALRLKPTGNCFE